MNRPLARWRALLPTAGVVSLVLGTGGAVLALDASETATNQVQVCEVLGGDADVTEHRDGKDLHGIDVSCKGGLLDGMNCTNVPGYPDKDRPIVDCGFDRVVTVDEQQVPPGERIEIEPGEPLEELPSGTGVDVPALTGEQPTLAEAVIMPGAAGTSIKERALQNINGCKALGGDPQWAEEPGAITVYCDGGGMDGVWCMHAEWGSLCVVLTQVQAVQPDPITPAAQLPTVEGPVATQPAAAPTPTAMPTEAPAPPTEAPVEPTVAPTAAPPPPPKVDGGPPSVPIDPNPDAPTPTPVILT